MVYYTYNYSIHGVYKPTYNWGGATLYTYLGPYNRGVFERIGRIANVARWAPMFVGSKKPMNTSSL